MSPPAQALEKPVEMETGFIILTPSGPAWHVLDPAVAEETALPGSFLACVVMGDWLTHGRTKEVLCPHCHAVCYEIPEERSVYDLVWAQHVSAPWEKANYRQVIPTRRLSWVHPDVEGPQGDGPCPKRNTPDSRPRPLFTAPRR